MYTQEELLEKQNLAEKLKLQQRELLYDKSLTDKCNGMVKLYIDGELISYGSCSLGTQSPWVYIGRTSSSDPYFIGYVGPCRIYNRELEEDEIMGLSKEYAGK